MSFVAGIGGGAAVEFERLDSEDDKIGILGASQTTKTEEVASILNRYDLSNVEGLEAGRVTQLPENIIDFAEELSLQKDMSSSKKNQNCSMRPLLKESFFPQRRISSLS